MSNQRLVETYLARARELEDHAQRVEQNPPLIHMSPRWRDTAFLRRGGQTAARRRLGISPKQPDSLKGLKA